MNADGCHKVCEHLPHLQTTRLAGSAVEIVVPPQMPEKSVDAIALSIDTGIRAVVETAECSVQFSPTLVDQEICYSAIEVSVDTRTIFSEAGVLVIPTLLEKSIGASVVERTVGSLTKVVSKISSNDTKESLASSSPTMQPTGDKATNGVETAEKAVGEQNLPSTSQGLCPLLHYNSFFYPLDHLCLHFYHSDFILDIRLFWV